MRRRVLGRSSRFATRIVATQRTSARVSRFVLGKTRCTCQDLSNRRCCLRASWFRHLRWKSYTQGPRFEGVSREARRLRVVRFFSYFLLKQDSSPFSYKDSSEIFGQNQGKYLMIAPFVWKREEMTWKRNLVKNTWLRTLYFSNNWFTNLQPRLSGGW